MQLINPKNFFNRLSLNTFNAKLELLESTLYCNRRQRNAPACDCAS